jgi:hypothetical protein
MAGSKSRSCGRTQPNEAESIEDREKVAGNVRNHHSRTRIFLIPKEAFSWNAPVKSGASMKLGYYVSITRLE